MIEGIIPDGYEIKTRHLHTLEDGTEIWVLKYKEFYTEEDYKRCEDLTKKMLSKKLKQYKFDDTNHTFSYELQGPRGQILSVLAGEFLSVSSFGTTTFKDLMAIFATKYYLNSSDDPDQNQTT